jgi:hypothetical protein
VELKPALSERGLERRNELAAEDAAEHFDGKEEGSTRRDPAIMIEGKTTSGDYAVDMRMMLQALIPGVKHTKKADVGTEMARIAGDLQQAFGFGTMTFGEMEGYPTLGGVTQNDVGPMVAKAFEAGVNLFDTADVYALRDSERFLGEALRSLGAPRESYLIAIKAFGHDERWAQ